MKCSILCIMHHNLKCFYSLSWILRIAWKPAARGVDHPVTVSSVGPSFRSLVTSVLSTEDKIVSVNIYVCKRCLHVTHWDRRGEWKEDSWESTSLSQQDAPPSCIGNEGGFPFGLSAERIGAGLLGALVSLSCTQTGAATVLTHSKIFRTLSLSANVAEPASIRWNVMVIVTCLFNCPSEQLMVHFSPPTFLSSVIVIAVSFGATLEIGLAHWENAVSSSITRERICVKQKPFSTVFFYKINFDILKVLFI